MNFDYLKEKKQVVSIALLGISALLAALILIKVVGFFVVSVRAENLIENAVANNKLDAEQVEKYLANSKTVADELKKMNLFAPPPPKQQPIKQVWGILGDEVLINDRWYKVGEMVQDAKIVAIGPTQIKIDWDGREITLAPIDAVISSPAELKPKELDVAKEGQDEKAEMVVAQSEEKPMFGPGDRGGFGPFPGGGPRFGEGIRERFQNLSEADRDRLRREMEQRREQFMNMSPEQRQRFIEEMRERFGGRGPGGGSDRGPGGRR